MSTPDPPDPKAPTVEAAGPGDSSERDESSLRAALRHVLDLPDAELAAGTIIDDAYRIERTLGAGGMGRVYLAHDRRLSRDVAIKVHTSRIHDPGGVRLRREAAALAKLNHPHVVTVYDAGTFGGAGWVAMEYVPGGTARTWSHAASRTPREILALYLAAGRGLAAAHNAGLVHRDFKPDNVLVGDDGRIRVADFGLARAAEPAGGAVAPDDAPVQDLTRTGAIVGTPAYMAPEQRDGGSVGPLADQFAFAVSLWEALAGERPFRGTTGREVAEAVAAGDIAILPASRAPRHVERALRRALSADPAARWPNMDQLLTELARDPSARRRRLVVGGVALAAFGAAIALSVASAGGGGPRRVSCAAAGDAILASWEPARSGRLRSALAAARPDGDAVNAIAIIDDWARRWRAQRIEVCEAVQAGGDQSSALLDLRGYCLDHARAGLDATVTLLARATPARADQARALAFGLPDLTACADVPRLLGTPAPPADAKTRADVAAVQAELARVDVLLHAGERGEALALAREQLARADALGRPGEGAAARLAVGMAMVGSGTYDGVLPLLEEGARLAATARDDRLVASIWLAVLDLLGGRLEDPGEADRLVAVADAAVLRAGSPPLEVVRLDVIRGNLRTKAGDFAAARDLYTRALANHERAIGPDDPRLAHTLSGLSTALRQLEDLAGSRQLLERAARLLEAAYGPRHPHLAAVLTNLGTTLQLAGHLSTARATLERALAIKEALVGVDHLDLAPTLVNLANTLIQLGEFEAAQRHVERALVIIEQRLGPDHPRIATVLGVLSDVQLARADWAGAERSLDRALVIAAPMLRPELLAGRGQVRLAQHQLPGARADFEEALAFATTAKGATSFAAGELRVALAMVTIAEGQRSRGFAEFEQGLALMRGARGPYNPQVREAEARLVELRKR